MKEKLKFPTIRMPKQCPLKYMRKLIKTTPNCPRELSSIGRDIA